MGFGGGRPRLAARPLALHFPPARGAMDGGDPERASTSTSAAAAMPPTTRWSPKRAEGEGSPETRFLAGLTSGAVVAAVANPYDRALYLSVRDGTRFLSRVNWDRPYHGFGQAVVHRTLSGGLYFPLHDTFYPWLYRTALRMLRGQAAADVGASVGARAGAGGVGGWEEELRRRRTAALVAHTAAGNAAGAVSGVLLNGFSAVKYAAWGREGEEARFARTAWSMWRHGGVRAFANGTSTTVARDAVFGGAYAAIKHALEEEGHDGFLVSVVAAGAATVLSSPINYARNVKYAASFKGGKTGQSLKVTSIVRELFWEAWNHTEGGFLGKADFLAGRLRIGWGTARVAFGMAATSELYIAMVNVLEPTPANPSSP